MRTKFLSVIVGFLLVSVAICSCLDSNEVREYSTDTTIHAFSLDTVHGVDYRFEIDQLNNLIYNPDSMPMDADTLIDSIQVDVMKVTWGVTSADTAFATGVYHNLLPAMNATGNNGVKLEVHAVDGVTVRTYTLQIRVHRQDPDSLTWVNMDTVGDIFSGEVNEGEQKAVALNGDILLYTSPAELYRTSGATDEYGWSRSDVTGLPDDADVTSLVAFDGRLYMLAGNDVYVSDAAGVAWTKADGLSGNVVALIADLPANRVMDAEAVLAGICLNDAGARVFCTTADGQTWTLGDEVPAGFPTDHFYYANYTTGAGARQVLAVGMPLQSNERTIPWVSNDGLEWAELTSRVEGSWCPPLDNPFIMYYDDNFYAFGGGMDAIYSSASGIGWQQVERKFLLPADFAGKRSYTIVVDPTPADVVSADDKRNFIWVIFGGKGTPNEVWRGRLNKLGFERE